MVECPTCGKEYDSDRAMKAHHNAHDEPYYDMVVRDEMGMSPEEFVRKYHRQEKLPLKQVGEKIGASLQTIKQMAERHGVGTLSQSEAKKAMWEREEDTDKFLSEAHKKTREMVDEGEHNFQDEDFERVQPDEIHERNQYAQFRTNFNGYESWRSHDPDGKQRVMKVHRLLAIAEFGPEAVKDLHVHHKKNIPWLNTYENICLMHPEDHGKEHYEEREIDELGRFS